MARKNLLKGFKMPKGITFEHNEKDKFKAVFVAYPFERGYGTTIGNSLRRILLSSIQGSAVTALRVVSSNDAGEAHVISSEYEVIPGVVEDTLEVIQRLKKLQVSLPEDIEQKTIIVDCKGPGVVTGASIAAVSDVEVTNPDYRIMTLSENADFQLELKIDLGRGYVPAEVNQKYIDVIGTIPIDAIFSPVKNVKVEIENTRVGHRNDYDKLVLDIETDGSIRPEDALAEAAKIAKEHFSVFINFDEESIAGSDEVDEDEIRIQQILDTPVEELELSVRSSNCLRNAQIRTLRDLTKRTEDEIAKTRNFGRKSLTEIKEKLKEWGLTLGMTDFSVLKTSQKFKINKEEENEA
ncbi:MAG: DNA-directed RNA polymerase subunit alpha [Spirochaetales bacterium]|nr:DNA-directed RNA polymerase subunit alpha [Spirochaetales bacterium]